MGDLILGPREQDSISAINLMEFSSKTQHVRKKHQVLCQGKGQGAGGSQGTRLSFAGGPG